MADAMPISPQELIAELELRERLIALNRNSTGTRSVPPTTPAERKAAEKKRERFFLHTLFNMLRLLSPTLLELELSLQAIQSPSFFSHVGCPSNVWPYQNHPAGPLEFPKLTYLFYACPPSGVLPWSLVTCQRILQPHIEGAPTSDTSSDLLAEETEHVPFSCPRLMDLTVVCDDSQAGDPDESIVVEEEDEDEATYETERRPSEEQADYSGLEDENLLVQSQCSPLTSLAPSLHTVTLLASTPAKAITAVYSASSITAVYSASSIADSTSIPSTSLETALVAELELAAAAAEWESLFVPYAYEESTVSSIPSQSRYSALDSAVDGAAIERIGKGMPETVEKVICAPKVRWDDSWDAFKNGVQKGLAEAKKMREESESCSHRIDVCVVRRSEVS